MIEKLDSEIVILNNEKYLVYLKRVKVKARKNRKGETKIKAFVRKVDKN